MNIQVISNRKNNLFDIQGGETICCRYATLLQKGKKDVKLDNQFYWNSIGVRGHKIWGGGRQSARRARNARELPGGSGGMVPRENFEK